MDDNAFIHQARSVKNWFVQHESGSKNCIANVWYSPDANALQEIIDWMPKRIRAVIRGKGASIKY